MNSIRNHTVLVGILDEFDVATKNIVRFKRRFLMVADG